MSLHRRGVVRRLQLDRRALIPWPQRTSGNARAECEGKADSEGELLRGRMRLCGTCSVSLLERNRVHV